MMVTQLLSVQFGHIRLVVVSSHQALNTPFHSEQKSEVLVTNRLPKTLLMKAVLAA